MKKFISPLKTQKLLREASNLCQQGLLSEAKKIYQDLVSVIPHHPDVLGNLGTIELQNGNQKIGIKYLEDSIKKNPHQPAFITNLANGLIEIGRTNESIKYFELAISLNPRKTSEAYYNLGRAHKICGDFEKAILCYQEAIKINPNNFLAILNLGFIYNQVQQYDLAIDTYSRGIEKNASDIQLIYNRGVTFLNQDKYQLALIDFNQAIALDQNFELALIQKAITLKYLNDYENALINVDRAININSQNPYNLNLKATILESMKYFREALSNYDQAISLNKNYPEAEYNKSMCLLAQEIFEDGWSLYDSRWRLYQSDYIKTSKPELTHFNVVAESILIWAEQGVGDQIIYSSLLSEAFKTKNTFLVSLDYRLLNLFQRSFSWASNVKFIPSNENVSEALYDFHIPIGSLGKFFRKKIQDFNRHPKGYLINDGSQRNSLRNKLFCPTSKICGIAWKSQKKDIGSAKSINLSDLIPILSIPNITFVNLQYGETQIEIQQLLNDHGIEIKSLEEIDNFNNIDGLSSLISACDFIVTTSNVTAHLAGALHKDTYLLIPNARGKIWYWGESRQDCLWYSSMSIFRNSKLESFKESIKNLSVFLRKYYE